MAEYKEVEIQELNPELVRESLPETTSSSSADQLFFYHDINKH